MRFLKTAYNRKEVILWLVLGFFLIIIWSGLAQANGGQILLVEEVGAYQLTVTVSPFPLRVGLNDISILLGLLADGQLVLDAQVSMTAEPIDHAGETQVFAATHANATNKLYYAANVDFPTPGLWELMVQVDGPEGSAKTAFEAQVEEGQTFDFSQYVSLVGLPLIIMVILFIVLSRRTRNDPNDRLHRLTGEDQ